MRPAVRPTVHIPTLSPLVGKAVFAVHQDPSTEAKPVRSGSGVRNHSPLPISQRKPWGANASTPRKNSLPISPQAERLPPRTDSRRSSAVQSPTVGATRSVTPVRQVSTETSHLQQQMSAVLDRLDAVENENKMLRSLVLELTSQINSVRQEVRVTSESHNSHISDLVARTNYVVGWVDHFNGLVAHAEQSVHDESNSTPDVARALDMGADSNSISPSLH